MIACVSIISLGIVYLKTKPNIVKRPNNLFQINSVLRNNEASLNYTQNVSLACYDPETVCINFNKNSEIKIYDRGGLEKNSIKYQLPNRLVYPYTQAISISRNHNEFIIAGSTEKQNGGRRAAKYFLVNEQGTTPILFNGMDEVISEGPQETLDFRNNRLVNGDDVFRGAFRIDLEENNLRPDREYPSIYFVEYDKYKIYLPEAEVGLYTAYDRLFNEDFSRQLTLEYRQVDQSTIYIQEYVTQEKTSNW